MSIIFGIRGRPGELTTKEDVFSMAKATDSYAPDGIFVLTRGRVGFALQPYYTHARSTLDRQPAMDKSGNILALDGRIDNHLELCEMLSLDDAKTPDSLIALSAFHRWGRSFFPRLIGEWAIAIWSAQEETLYLGRDLAGTRTLFYSEPNGRLIWSTYLDTFFVKGAQFPLNPEYAAAYLGCRPGGGATPYIGIRAVPAMHIVVIRGNVAIEEPYWDWSLCPQLRLKTDSEYDERFLRLFRQAVERRTGPGAPVVSHLSGGMDSTAMVCVCDRLRKDHHPGAELLATLSFYDDSEPDWNERPYFTVVESTRGVRGIHIETSWLQRTYESPDAPCRIYLCPGADSASIQHEQRMEASIWCAGFRTILSGIGGDEVLGGVPTPLPELAAYLASGQFSRFVRRATEWSLVSRDPLGATIWNTLRYAHRLYWLPTKANRAIPFWFTPRLRRYCCRSTDLAERISGLGRGPVAVHNAQTWSSMLETLPHLAPSLLVRYEYRYPFLDRDLVEFLFGIPREQLVLPGRRRALMRRALRGIVPDPVLERPRKAFLIKGPLLSLQRARAKILGLFQTSLTAGQGFINDDPFRRAFDEVVRHENAEDLQPVLRTILFELWLRACAIDPTTSPFDTSALRIR